MEKIKTRGMYRSMFTKTLKKLSGFIENVQIRDAEVTFKLLSDHMTQIKVIDEAVIQELIGNDAVEEDIENELESMDKYKSQFIRAELDLARLTRDENFDAESRCTTVVHSERGKCSTRKMMLTKIELYKFDGDQTNWLKFWSQFKSIDEDEELSSEDKFQYLLQSMTSGSRACDLVSSFPPTGDNYHKAIESLKARYGRSDLLVEVYIRKLLQLVVESNINKSRSNFQVSLLYDKLESSLRSLESLKVMNVDCAVLFPLVESSLPEELLRVWQRSCRSTPEPKDRLKALMAFLKSEAENEERIKMATRGFVNNTNNAESKGKRASAIPEDNIPTASSLVAGEGNVFACIFCSESHESSLCNKVKRMTLGERENIVKEKNVCFRCLKLGHGFRTCRSNKKCTWCGRKHILLMCREAASPSSSQSNTKERETLKTVSNISVHQNVFLQTLRVKLHYNGKTKIVRSIIDSGSQHSYILKEVADYMQYKSLGNTVIQHGLFGGLTSSPETHKQYRISVQKLSTSFTCDIDVFDKPQICTDIPIISDKTLIQKINDMNVFLTDIEENDEPISLLIGADMLPKLLTNNMKQLDSGLAVIESRLGWTLIGKRIGYTEGNDTTLNVVSLFIREDNISDLWKLDTLGIMDPAEKKSKDVHVQEIKQFFKATTIFNQDGKYEVLLPWKENHPPLSSNKEIAYKRLEKVTAKLKCDNYYELYGKIFNDWLSEGIIEKVPDCEYSNVNCHYLPHKPVIRLSNSTTPVRPVFDASARSSNCPSINQCLETGPNLIELIPNILLRFREKEIGVISDIRKAFLQISISQKDRNLLRFLWWDDNDSNKLQVYRHCRVVFGLTCSPFLLEATIEHHLLSVCEGTDSDHEKSFIGKLLKSFYVDNSVTSVSSVDELNEFRDKAIAVMKKGGFELRCWEHSGDNCTLHKVNVLGLKWNKQRDVLSLDGIQLEHSPSKITKRFILSATHTIFDIIGLVCPILVEPKHLLRDLCNDSYDWDTDVSEAQKDTFLKWYSQIHMINQIEIPRCLIGSLSEQKVSFHLFVDASQYAYAAVVFARIETVSGVNVRFVQAKSRVAPKSKGITIPRLELLAASIGARLIRSIMSALDCDRLCSVSYWSDSAVVLSWIKRNCQWARFVWNRVQEIRQLTNANQWHFVPGDKNPADLPSRGCDVEFLIESKWWEGPQWLRDSEESWRVWSNRYDIDEAEVTKEMKKSKLSDTHKNVTVGLCSDKCDSLDSAWYTRYFSNYESIVRMVAWVIRFVNNCRLTSNSRVKTDISGIEYQNAELRLLRIFQQDTFSSLTDTRLKSLKIFVDSDGLYRLESPLVNKRDSYSFRCPIVLSSEHVFTTRLIMFEHIRNCHAGVQTLLNIMRETYWILKGRKAVRSVVDKCTVCRRFKMRSYDELPPALPQNRTDTSVGVFEIIGIDYAGPLYLKDRSKVWVCLFTCAVYRAVHLELVCSLTAEDFLQAFRRFVARRGSPKVVYSDNATNFTCASKLLKVKWKFNPPSAAWWGGFFERLIGVVKNVLKRILGTARLNYVQLLTALCECEFIVNSRPISYVTDDSNEPRPMTPSMFLMESYRSHEGSLVLCDDIESSTNNLGKQYRHLKKIRLDLVRKFRVEYLGFLSRRKNKLFSKVQPKVGEVVLVGNDTDKRLHWPLAVIMELIPGRDGRIRLAKVRTKKGTLVRPIQRLYPLEVL